MAAIVCTFFLGILLTVVVECTPRSGSPKMQLENYCNRLKTCQDCKSAKFPCEWCHNVGCTRSAHHYCPKVFLQSMKMSQDTNTCPRIDAGSAVFVAANIRNIIKVNITANDWDIENHRIVCILEIDYKTIKGAGTMHDRTIYCDMAAIKIKRDVMVAKLKVNWGGADPISNNVLVVVYRCEGLANNCGDCKNVHDEFDCGWCEESSSCTVLQNCPRQLGKWSPKGSSCYRENVFAKPQHTHVKAKKNMLFKTF